MICNKTENCFQQMLKLYPDAGCDRKERCVMFCDRRSEAVCREKGKSYHLLNTEENRYKILSVLIDGGVVVMDKQTPVDIKKCDYLFLADKEEGTKPIAVLIELKGVDIKKAIEQISNTLSLFEAAFGHCGKVYGRIVFAGGTPNIRNIPSYMSLQRELKKRGGDLAAAKNIVDRVQELI